MIGDWLGEIAMSLWIFGWAALWPLARFGLHRPRAVCRELLWIFLAALVLQLASMAWIWDLRASGTRDWPMALLFPQTIASVAWFASLLAFFRRKPK